MKFTSSLSTLKKDTFHLNYERSIIACLSSLSSADNLARNIDFYTHILSMVFTTICMSCNRTKNVTVNNNLKSKLSPYQRDHTSCAILLPYIFFMKMENPPFSLAVLRFFIYIHFSFKAIYVRFAFFAVYFI